MALLRYKLEKWNVAPQVARVLAVILVVTLLTGLSACQKRAEHGSEYRPETVQETKALCEDEWRKTLASCPAVREPSDREHMIAVLREQMNGLSEQDKQRRCRELNSFWQVACGVTPTQ